MILKSSLQNVDIIFIVQDVMLGCLHGVNKLRGYTISEKNPKRKEVYMISHPQTGTVIII